MSSQPSTSSVSDVTCSDEGIVILEDLSRHFTVMRDPQRIKCNYCNESWKSLTATTKKARLSSLKFSSQYKIRLCSQTPANISKIMINKLKNNLNENKITKYLFTNKDSKNKIKILIDLSKDKTIKEKNIQNKVIKYNLSLSANIKIIELNTSREI